MGCSYSTANHHDRKENVDNEKNRNKRVRARTFGSPINKKEFESKNKIQKKRSLNIIETSHSNKTTLNKLLTGPFRSREKKKRRL